MQLRKDSFEIENSPPLETHEVSIKSPVMMFDILCNRTYQYPLATMVQEYMANARDAHRERGNVDEPIEVSFPVKLEPNLIITDYGIGISPQRMVDVFIYLGESTKREDNNSHGGYGIGAKVGYAYAEVFMIVSRHKGERREYRAYIGDDRLGHIDLIAKGEYLPDDRDGVSIVIPIEDDDMYDVARHALKCCYFWELQPILHNLPKPLEVVPLDDWVHPSTQMTLINDPYIYSKILHTGVHPLLIVDGIIYGPLPDKSEFEYDKLLPPIGIFIGVGEVDLAVNREGLQYTNETMIRLKQIIHSNILASKDRATSELISASESSIQETSHQLALNGSNVVTKTFVNAQWGHFDVVYIPYSDKRKVFLKIPFGWSAYRVSRPQWNSDVRAVDIVKIPRGSLASLGVHDNNAYLPIDIDARYCIDDRTTQEPSAIMVRRWYTKKTVSDGEYDIPHYVIKRKISNRPNSTHRSRRRTISRSVNPDWVFYVGRDIPMSLLSTYVKRRLKIGSEGTKVEKQLFRFLKPYAISTPVDTDSIVEWVNSDPNNKLILHRRVSKFEGDRLYHEYKDGKAVMSRYSKNSSGHTRFFLVSNKKWLNKLLTEPQTCTFDSWIDQVNGLTRNIRYELFKKAIKLSEEIYCVKYELDRLYAGSMVSMKNYRYSDRGLVKGHIQTNHEIWDDMVNRKLEDPYLQLLIRYGELSKNLNDMSINYTPASWKNSRRKAGFIKNVRPELSMIDEDNWSLNNGWDMSKYPLFCFLAHERRMNSQAWIAALDELVCMLNNKYLNRR